MACLHTQQSIHCPRGLLMKRLREMAIGIERQGDRAVAEQILDDLRVRARREQNACRGVAQIMHTNPR